MVRRKRSYGKGKDPLGVFINNALADSQKRERERKKAAQEDEKRRAKADERERLRLEKLAERARAQAEREALKQKKIREKIDAKAEAVALRLEADMEKMGLYPGRDFLSDTSRRAVSLSVTPASAKKYFLGDDESRVAKICAEEFLRDHKIGPEYQQFGKYDNLLEFVANYRPQQYASSEKPYLQLRSELEGAMQDHLSKLKREDERRDLIEILLKEKLMFRDEIEEFAQIVDERDWGSREARNSDEFKERVKNKSDYVSEIKSQIHPITLSKFSG